jgi:2-oxoglutarate ferredoxin oxidoreductase subunit delta
MIFWEKNSRCKSFCVKNGYKEIKMPKGRIEVATDRCKGCGLCIEACPLKLLELDKNTLNMKGYQPMRIHTPDKCIGCANCAVMCPDVVITVYRLD